MWADRSLFHKVPLIIFLKINLSVIHCMLSYTDAKGNPQTAKISNVSTSVFIFE